MSSLRAVLRKSPLAVNIYLTVKDLWERIFERRPVSAAQFQTEVRSDLNEDLEGAGDQAAPVGAEISTKVGKR